ncbi:hypothetical protein [Rhodoferax ferrireducens]|uniref:hypothetical protein n=1 Tax=Rhodoferax ferrireducens TaxID=192843 RepID=UPI001E56947A|nr:hypothetical protein [Rhodoferax ferrireducens]
MKITRHIALILGLLVVLVCSWIAPMDAPAMTQVDAGLKRALVSFASARALNGLLSVVQAAQVDIQPAGIGVTLSPGQLLAPVNELVKHFADLMLLACVAFGIQKVLISISGYWLISVALTVVALAWAASHLRQSHAPRWLSRALVLMLMLRFAIPVALLGTDALSQKFLAADYTAAQSAIDTTTAEAGKVKAPEPSASDDKSWLPKVPNWVPSLLEVKDRYTKMKQAVEQSTEHMVKLMVVFLLQTMLLPLLMLWALFGIARVSVEQPSLLPSNAG